MDATDDHAAAFYARRNFIALQANPTVSLSRSARLQSGFQDRESDHRDLSLGWVPNGYGLTDRVP
jgi:hypothetical protein